jgi:death on curing protein
LAKRTRRTKEPNWLLRSVVEATHDALLVEHGGAPGVRDARLLESALARPRTLFAYGKVDVFELAAAYAFGIVRNHPFVDGNKRAAFVAAFVFMRINGRHLVADEVSAASSMLRLAAGEWDEAAFSAWLRANANAG